MLTAIASFLTGKLAKGIVGIWLKDHAILGLAADEALNRAQNFAANSIEERKIERFIQAIEDDIIEVISKHLEQEFRQFRSGDKILVIEFCSDLVLTKEFYESCFNSSFDPSLITDAFENKLREFCEKI